MRQLLHWSVPGRKDPDALAPLTLAPQRGTARALPLGLAAVAGLLDMVLAAALVRCSVA
jgi:hypothetical protein